MAENRLTRELETRTQQERPKQWAPAELLPEPDKLTFRKLESPFVEPEGFNGPVG